VASLKLANDALAVSIDVSANLHHWCAPVSACQRRQQRFWGYPRDLDVAPTEPFDANSHAHLFSHKGLRIVMEDNLRSWIDHISIPFNLRDGPSTNASGDYLKEATGMEPHGASDFLY
jgi:hypothetical protein